MIVKDEVRAAARPRVGIQRPTWIYGPATDLAIALCWVPLFLVTHALTGGHGPANDHRLSTLFDAVFLLSLVHQPLTLALVYGDRNQFALRRRLFTWSPPVAGALVVLAVVAKLWIIIPIAAVWNTIHTLQQRYGLSRIYGRKSGHGSARLDRWILYAWMVAALLIVGSAPKTLAQLGRVMLDNRNADAIRTLSGVRPYALWLLVPALAVAAGLTWALIRHEAAARSQANPAKWMYQASSLALIASIAFDPLAGFTAYVGAHAIEYVIVVDRTMRSRYQGKADHSTFLGRVTGRTWARLGFLAGFMAAVALAAVKVNGQAYDIGLFSMGLLHFWYDGFIWKLRKPAVAETFGITPAT